MNQKRQVTVRGRHREVSQVFSRNDTLKSKANWDHPGAPGTRVGSPAESETAAGASWEKLSPFRTIIRPQLASVLGQFSQNVPGPKVLDVWAKQTASLQRELRDGRKELVGDSWGLPL